MGRKAATRRTTRKRKAAGRPAPAPAASGPPGGTWTFLSNHAHVLICLARDDDPTVRQIALDVGITERAVLKILAELEEAGYVARSREGRRNHYEVDLDVALRHPIEAHRTVGDLIAALLD